MVNRRHLGRWLHKPGMKAVKLISLDIARGEATIQEAQRAGAGFELREPRTIQGYREVRRYFIGHLGVLPGTWEPTAAGVVPLERREARAWLNQQASHLRWCVGILGERAVLDAMRKT